MSITTLAYLFAAWLILLLIAVLLDASVNSDLTIWVSFGGLVTGLVVLILWIGIINALIVVAVLIAVVGLVAQYLESKKRIWLILAFTIASVFGLVLWLGIHDFINWLAISIAILAVLAAVSLVIRAIISARLKRTVLEIESPTDNMKRKIGSDGELIPIESEKPHKVFTFRGSGSEVMDRSIFLTPGTYLMKHNARHSTDLTVTVIRVDTNEKEKSLRAQGKGSFTFTIEKEGCFVFRVEHPHAWWKIEVSSLL